MNRQLNETSETHSLMDKCKSERLSFSPSTYVIYSYASSNITEEVSGQTL